MKLIVDNLLTKHQLKAPNQLEPSQTKLKSSILDKKAVRQVICLLSRDLPMWVPSKSFKQWNSPVE